MRNPFTSRVTEPSEFPVTDVEQARREVAALLGDLVEDAIRARREVLDMRHPGEMTFDEIRQVMQRTSAAARGVHERALAALHSRAAIRQFRT